MDDTIGNFKKISEQLFASRMSTPEPMVFRVGEILEIRGSRLRIDKIKNKRLILRLLPQLEENKYQGNFDQL